MVNHCRNKVEIIIRDKGGLCDKHWEEYCKNGENKIVS